jgi:hypothetical protein
MTKTGHLTLVDNFVEKYPARSRKGPFDGHLIGVSRYLKDKKPI